MDRKAPRENGTWALSKEHDTNSPGHKRERPQEREYFEYNTDLLTMLKDVGTRFDLERSFPMKSPPESRDPKLYCQFHEDIGHETKNCRSLKRALDGLASKGNLKNYLQKNAHGFGKNQYKKNKSPVSPAEGQHSEWGFVAIISGGPAAGGPTMGGQKDYACRLGQVMLSAKSPLDPFPRIEICESDGGRIATPHDDPLMVEFKISNMRVKRSIIHPVGVITVPVRIGDRKNGRKMEVNFLIVKDLTAYNVILGRPILNKIKAVVVTHLMLLKFVYDDGAICTIRGDQQQARDCYLTTLNPSAWKQDSAEARGKRKHKDELPAAKESKPAKTETVTSRIFKPVLLFGNYDY
ncbi:uncharacterized protein [Spinacia oleracea]|uniref:Reverse transcriptase domain-containing protein n=1 Tax=Spinacia oleracea TaxID=3562 RepID=A0ABM3QZ78_SPIOL|nr:uncharacterized protein LOC110778835 [Spinacia oleracea]